MNGSNKYFRGDIIYVDLGIHPGSSVQSGIRPCVILSNNMSNKNSSILNIFPLTLQKKECPVHVVLDKNDIKGYLKKESDFLGEQPMTISKSQVKRKIGHIPEKSDTMKKIMDAVMLQLGLPA